MVTKHVQFTEENSLQWAGMGDYELISLDGRHSIEIKYDGEPPHGDSYHLVRIDGAAFPGYAWGCLFGFSACSRFAIFSWMSKLCDRRTVVIDMKGKCCFVLPEYIYQFSIDWPSIKGEGQLSVGKQYVFTGQEQWHPY